MGASKLETVVAGEKAATSGQELEGPFVLLEGLPDDLAKMCLARATRHAYANMRMVCRSWAAFLQTEELLELRKEACISEELLYTLGVTSAGQYKWGVLTPGTGTWRRLAPIPFLEPHRSLQDFQVCSIGPGLLLVLGGSVWESVSFAAANGIRIRREAASREVWVYRAATDTWHAGPPMRTARCEFACALVGNKVVVAGGSDLADAALADAEVLDLNQSGPLAEFRWEALPPLRVARRACLGAALEGRFWVVSGCRLSRTNDDPFLGLCDSAEGLDFETGIWSTVDRFWMSSQLPQHLAVFDGRIFGADFRGRARWMRPDDDSGPIPGLVWGPVDYDDFDDKRPIAGLAVVSGRLQLVVPDPLDEQKQPPENVPEEGLELGGDASVSYGIWESGKALGAGDFEEDGLICASDYEKQTTHTCYEYDGTYFTCIKRVVQFRSSSKINLRIYAAVAL